MKFESFPQPTPPQENIESKPEYEVKIPLVITWGMKQQLADLGYGAENRNQLTPEQAHSIIENQEVYKKQEVNTEIADARSQSKSSERAEVEPAIREMPRGYQSGIENLESEPRSPQEEISRLTESIEGTKEKINEIRGELNLPPTEEDPPSVASLRERLETLKTEEKASKQQEEIPDNNRAELENPNKESENADRKRKNDDRERKDEEKRPDEAFERKLELIEEMKKKIVEGFNASKRSFSESCEKYSDLGNSLKKIASKLMEKYPGVIKPEIQEGIAKKTKTSEELFDETIDSFVKNETFLFFNAASLERLLYFDPQSTSPEKLKEIQEITSPEKLEEINSSIDDYFERINDVARHWNITLENLKEKVSDFNVSSSNLDVKSASRFNQEKDDLLTLIDSEVVLKEYRVVLSSTPEIRNETKESTESANRQGDENLDKDKNEHDTTEYVSYQVGTRKKKGPEDRYGFTEVKKKKI